MKLIHKTYLLLIIVIAAAIVNLVLLLATARENENDLHALIHANNLKVTTERVAGLANSIASGNEEARENLIARINEYDAAYGVLRTGGMIDEDQVTAVPSELKTDYEKIGLSWGIYKKNALTIQKESVFDPEIRNTLRYVLEKNGQVLTLTDEITQDLSTLDRNYNRHKEIALELTNIATSIGEKTLLMSIGEGDEHREDLKKNRLLFDANLKKLLQLPLDNEEIDDLDIKPETLSPIPRENSDALRKLDPLWESLQPKLMVVETNSIISKEFGAALNALREERLTLLELTDDFANSWNDILDKKLNDRGLLIQSLLAADIAVILFVLRTIRSSLNPLNRLAEALGRIKEGIYGEKIQHTSKDEIGVLTDTFNEMSMTIKEKEDEAKKIEIAKDEFLAMITHELKTPLVPIQGYADILIRGHLGDLNKNQKERLEIIKSSSASLLALISDLLDVQKLELGQLRIKKKPQSIKEIVAKALDVLTPQATTDQIKLVDGIKKDIIVTCDDDRIRQVLTNLIKNSIKAAQPKIGLVEVLAEDSNDEVKISVKDNGKGIPKESQNKIFKKFYQVDTSSTREKGGSGLGLSICKGIVETHGGRIWFESEPGKGATFTFTLPKDQQTKSAI
ncbi:MAG TPA: HAMP domain-containing sensor histidine kinase [Nitrosopumilaceae archaeon]|nr:HAMP domain-containing sensor histidine kinase [Nitrosopumilaceae archaeon]